MIFGRSFTEPSVRRSLVVVGASLLSAVGPAALSAQEATEVPRVGARIRLTSIRGEDVRIDGVLLGADADSFRLRLPCDKRVSWSRREVAALEISEGLRDRESERENARSIGGVVGLVGGTLWAANGRPLEGPVLGISILIGTVIAPFGAMVGDALYLPRGEDERWRPSPLPADSTRIEPWSSDIEAARIAEARRSRFPIGTRIRVTRCSDGSRAVGFVAALDDALVMRDDDKRDVRVPWHDLLRVETSLGRPFALLRAVPRLTEERFRPTLLP